ncbi:MAG: hypothetical protein FJ224_07915 [Lentisphaerae bacterium]|nr:hypothetical protein [Lentisphaerota bacterium]
MLSTTVDAIRAMLKADPTVAVDERVWIVACIRNHGRRCRNQQAEPAEKCVISTKEVARRFSKSTRFIQRLANQGVLHRVVLPKHTRGCGFFSVEVDRLLTPPEVPADVRA